MEKAEVEDNECCASCRLQRCAMCGLRDALDTRVGKTMSDGSFPCYATEMTWRAGVRGKPSRELLNQLQGYLSVMNWSVLCLDRQRSVLEGMAVLNRIARWIHNSEGVDQIEVEAEPRLSDMFMVLMKNKKDSKSEASFGVTTIVMSISDVMGMVHEVTLCE